MRNNKYPSEIDPNAQAAQQAASWWALLNDGPPTDQETRAFWKWMTRSAENVQNYLEIARMDRALSSKPFNWPDTSIAELVRQAAAAPPEVSAFPLRSKPIADTPAPSLIRAARASIRSAGSARGASILRSRRLWVTAAVIASVASVSIGLQLVWGSQEYKTDVGERRSITLADGSNVTLNASSSIEVRFAKDRRRLRLTAGEALFHITPDASRPFDVGIGGAGVRVLGTTFNVRRRGRASNITVVEGSVTVFPDTGVDGDLPPRPSSFAPGAHVASLAVKAGEAVTLAPNVTARTVQADIAMATAWTRGELAFAHESLAQIAEEFNRYNHTVIRIDPRIHDKELTGMFRVNDPESFLAYLATFPDLQIDRSKDEVHVWLVGPRP
jgi:transmembrane sensor